MNTDKNISIEFAPAKEVTTTAASSTPMASTGTGTYEDLVFTPEYAGRRIRFTPGETWIRVLPALAKSKLSEYKMIIDTLEYEGGRFADPRTLERGARSVFAAAYGWAKRNCPDALYSKANKAGVRLLPDPLGACFVIVEENGRNVVRLLLASAYDGRRAGTKGLAHRIFEEIGSHDDSRTTVPDAVHPERGVRICIEQTVHKGNPRPVYSIRVGRQPAPIAAIIAEMDPEEISAIVPLENVVRRLTEEEEWTALAKLLAPDTVARMREELRG